MGWDGIGCACNSVHFNGGIHTLSYQRSPSHPIPFHPNVCVNAPLWLELAVGYNGADRPIAPVNRCISLVAVVDFSVGFVKWVVLYVGNEFAAVLMRYRVVRLLNRQTCDSHSVVVFLVNTFQYYFLIDATYILFCTARGFIYILPRLDRAAVSKQPTRFAQQ